jgi:hypothetical protein
MKLATKRWCVKFLKIVMKQVDEVWKENMNEASKHKILYPMVGSIHNTFWVLQLVNKMTIVFFYYNYNYKFMLMTM